MYHYTYKITNTNIESIKKFYIGVRSSKNEPGLDSYMGSSKILAEDINIIGKSFFIKEILGIYETREVANLHERLLLEDVDAASSLEWYNQTNGGADSHHTVGTVTVSKIGESKFFQIPIETYHKNKHLYKTSTTDSVPVKLSSGKIVRITSKEFYNGGEFRHISVGTCTVTRENSERKRLPFSDITCSDTKYWSGLIPVVDTETGKTICIESSHYDGVRYKNIKAGKISVKDIASDQIVTITCDEYYKNKEKYKVVILDKVVTCYQSDGSKISLSSEEYRANRDTLSHIHEKTIAAYDLEEDRIVRISTELFHNNKVRYKNVGHLSKVTIFDADGNKKFETISDFLELCKKEGLPMQVLQHSYLNNGKAIYTTKRGQAVSRINGNEQYIGWYAIKEKYNGKISINSDRQL